MKNITTILLAIIIVILGVLAFQSQDKKLSGIATQGQNYWISEVATSSVISVGASEKRVIATSTSRKWLNFSSRDCPGFYISLANDAPATASNTIFVASSTQFIISPTLNGYTGSVRAFAPITCNLLTVGE